MSKHVVVTFGRANPITAGHEKLFDKVASVAKEVGGSAHVHLSQSNDSKKNPLNHDDKVDLAKKMMPHHSHMFENEKHVRSLFDVMKHHSNPDHEIHVVAGSDRVEEYKSKLNQYNGKDFHFKKIHVHSAGDRDPDAEGATGISGTKMRHHATTGDYESFKKGAPSTASEVHVKSMYNKIRSNMNSALKESIMDSFRGKGILTLKESTGRDYPIGRKSLRQFLDEAAIKLSGKKTEVLIRPDFIDYQKQQAKEDPNT